MTAIFAYQQFRQQNVNIVTKIQTILLDFLRTFVKVNQLCGLENSFVSVPFDCQRLNKQIAPSLLSQTTQTKLDECGVFVTNPPIP